MCDCDFLRFVSDPDVEIEELPWGPHEWLVKEGITENEQLLLVRVRMPPGKAHQFHRHPEMEEALYFLEGRAEQWVGTEHKILGPGDVAHVPRNEVHGTYNIFEDPVVFLAILSPANTKGPNLIDVSMDKPWCDLKVPIDYDLLTNDHG